MSTSNSTPPPDAADRLTLEYWASRDMDAGSVAEAAATHFARQLLAARRSGEARPSPDLTTNDPRVVACMGSVPECAANGCQFRKTAGYRPGEGPTFLSAASPAPKSAEWGVDNCHALARREIRRLQRELTQHGGTGTTPASVAIGTWEHILRICEQTDAVKTPSVLREDSDKAPERTQVDYDRERETQMAESAPAAPLTDYIDKEIARFREALTWPDGTGKEHLYLRGRLVSLEDLRPALATQQAALRAIQDALVEAFYDPDPVDPDPELDYGRVDWVGVVKDVRKQIDKLKARLDGYDTAQRAFASQQAALTELKEIVDREVALTDAANRGGQHVGCSPRMQRSMALELRKIVARLLGAEGAQ